MLAYRVEECAMYYSITAQMVICELVIKYFGPTARVLAVTI